MVTEQLIRKQFIHQTMRQNLDIIINTQSQALIQVSGGRSRLSLSLLSQRNHQIVGSGLNISYAVSVPLSVRFLDICLREDKPLLYNRSIWGILYRNAYPTLRFGLSKEIKQSIHDRLQKMSPDIF